MGIHQNLTGAQRVAKRRAALRAQGFKLKQFWVPDVNDPKVQADIRRGVAAINASKDESEVMAYIASAYEELMADEPDYDWGPDGPPEGSANNA